MMARPVDGSPVQTRSRWVLIAAAVVVAACIVFTINAAQSPGIGSSIIGRLGIVSDSDADDVSQGGDRGQLPQAVDPERGQVKFETTTIAPAGTTTTTARAGTTSTRPSIFQHWGDGNTWLELITTVQKDCSLTADDIPLNPGGGFASKFQLVAAKAMKTLRQGKAFRLVGHFAGYSATKPCEDALGEDVYKKEGSYTCYFQSERTCKGSSEFQGASSEVARERFKSLSKDEEPQLYHALEAYLFRMNSLTLSQFESRHTLVGYDPNRDTCLAGIHARRGDKVVDAYNRYYTSKEYAQAIYTWVTKAPQCSQGDEICTVYVASDSALVLPEIKSLLEPVIAGKCRFRVIGNERSVTQKAMDSHQFDHLNEIQGMAGKVQLLPGTQANEATLDILFDLYMLSRAEFFVGTLTSQIGRIAAGLKNGVMYAPAKGSSPVALDYTNWKSVEGMGGGDGIPTPLAENWVPQPSDDFSLDKAPGLPLQARPVDTDSAPVFDAAVTLQADCARAHVDVDVGKPAGAEFAELLRRAAVQAAAAWREGKRVEFVGHFAGYSDLNVCQERLGTKVFSDRGSFACYLLPESTCEVASSGDMAIKAADALKQAWSGHGGDLQLVSTAAAWMLRHTEETKAELMKREWIARIANVAAPLIACQISGEKAVGGRGPGVAEYVEALKAWATSAAARAPWGNRTASCAVFVASDGDEAVVEMQKLLHTKEHGQCHFVVSGLHEYWAHHHYKDGWPGRLKGQDGRWAARDILFDLDVLSRADVLFASVASPLARLAVLLRRAKRGQVITEAPAFALDFETKGGDLQAFERPLWARRQPGG